MRILIDIAQISGVFDFELFALGAVETSHELYTQIFLSVGKVYSQSNSEPNSGSIHSGISNSCNFTS